MFSVDLINILDFSSFIFLLVSEHFMVIWSYISNVGKLVSLGGKHSLYLYRVVMHLIQSKQLSYPMLMLEIFGTVLQLHKIAMAQVVAWKAEGRWQGQEDGARIKVQSYICLKREFIHKEQFRNLKPDLQVRKFMYRI